MIQETGRTIKYKIVDEFGNDAEVRYRFKFVWWCNITNGSTSVYLCGDETTAHPKNTTDQGALDMNPIRHISAFGVWVFEDWTKPNKPATN